MFPCFFFGGGVRKEGLWIQQGLLREPEVQFESLYYENRFSISPLSTPDPDIIWRWGVISACLRSYIHVQE